MMDRRWHKKKYFSQVSNEANKEEMRDKENTAEGKNTVKVSRDAYFKDKCGNAAENRFGSLL